MPFVGISGGEEQAGNRRFDIAHQVDGGDFGIGSAAHVGGIQFVGAGSLMAPVAFSFGVGLTVFVPTAPTSPKGSSVTLSALVTFQVRVAWSWVMILSPMRR